MLEDDIVDNDRMDIDVSDLSETDVRHFIEGSIWRCMRKHLENRLDMSLRLMEMAPPDDVWGAGEDGRVVLEREGVRRLQGEVTELRFLLQLPQSYIDEMNMDKEEEKDGTTN